MKISGNVPVIQENFDFFYHIDLDENDPMNSQDKVDPLEGLDEAFEHVMDVVLEKFPLGTSREVFMPYMVIPKALQSPTNNNFSKQTFKKVESDSSSELKKDITLELAKIEQAVQDNILNQARNLESTEEAVQKPFDAATPE